MFQKLERRIENIGFEKAAFYLILFFGICLRIVTPPFQTLDEINHLTRAWQVSEGIFCSPAEEFRKVESGNNPTTKSLLHWALNGKESVSLHNEDEKFLVAVVPGSMTPPYYAIEFDWAKKWYEGFGQALWYAHNTGKKPCLVLILKSDKDYKYFNRAKILSDKYNVNLIEVKSKEYINELTKK